MSASQKLARERIDNSFTYHAPTPDKAKRYEDLRSSAKSLAITMTEYCPESLELSMALSKLEEAVMWANAAIARND
jgi:hypothetical protein